MHSRAWKCIGPITLSALSLFISFFIFQPLALFFGPSFDLLASRGVGKVAFVTMAIYQIILLLLIMPQKFLNNFLKTNLFFLIKEKWLPQFSLYFTSFFFLHWFLLVIFYLTGYLVYQPGWGTITPFLVGKTIFGLFVVFMLAWTEELIFRGTIYPYFLQYYKPVSSLFITSFIFMIVHNLKNPLALITTDWQLGLGLFLLGLLLNQTFVITKKLYTGMGIHAGLVFVKVVLRRARFLDFIGENQWAWWVHRDLRQSHLIHILFILTIIFVFVRYKEKFVQK